MTVSCDLSNLYGPYNLNSEDGNALNQLKRNKRELEQQLEELREELEETTSDLERAEQARDRLQVQNERDRVQMKSEMEAKDLELEESRSTLQKRIKNLENQLDDEASERKKIVEQRKEAEAKLMVCTFMTHSLSNRRDFMISAFHVRPAASGHGLCDVDRV